MIPKVTASRVESGYIKYNILIGDVDFYAEDEIEVKIPEKLKKSFTIGNILVEEGDIVNEGDTLVLFESSSYNDLLNEHEKEINRLKIELMEFDKNYTTKINQLEKDVQDLDSQIEKYREHIAVSCVNAEELYNKMEDITKLELQQKQKIEELNKNKKLYEADIITYQDIERIEKELKALEEQIKSEYSRYDRLQQKLLNDYKDKVDEGEYKSAQLLEELEYIKSKGILSGRSRALIAKELEEAEQMLEFISKYPELKSPIDGIVEKVFYKSLDSYEGVKTIILLKQGEEFNHLIVGVAGKYENGDSSDIFKEDMSCVLKYGKHDIEGKITGNISKNGKRYLLINIGETSNIDKSKEPKNEKQSNMKIKLPETNESITMEVKGDYCDILVPNSAFISGDELFVMKTRKGFWGDEYYAVKQKVQTGEGNEYFTQITGGLVRNDTVITGWDRTLIDGATVTLPLK